MRKPTHSPSPNSRPLIRFLILFCVIFPLALAIPNLLAHTLYYPSICRQHAAEARLTMISYSMGSRKSPAACTYVEGAIPLASLGGPTAAASRMALAIYTPIGCFLLVMAGLFARLRRPTVAQPAAPQPAISLYLNNRLDATNPSPTVLAEALAKTLKTPDAVLLLTNAVDTIQVWGTPAGGVSMEWADQDGTISIPHDSMDVKQITLALTCFIQPDPLWYTVVAWARN
ncbi:MAG: hypothetical protein H0T53_06620 [Herpetosiphonaceae bacterium]|nr:hypothetical protein [Herpetosiphonaceae bacterium]